MSRRDFEINLDDFIEDLIDSADAIKRGAGRGLDDVADLWRVESRDLAPLKTSRLRDNIAKKVDKENLVATVSANVYEKSKKWPRFNYAYYIHDVKGEIKNPTTQGTIAKFLDKPLEDNEDRWLRHIESQIQNELRGEGW
ncbi:HK97 gp10 family phage protein [Fredinandcohnia humi]